MPDALSPGMRVLCRDAEWLVTRTEPSSHDNRHQLVHCIGTDDLTRGHEAVFLTQLDAIEPVDPAKTDLVPDESSGFRKSKLLLEAHLRSLPATGIEPDPAGLGTFRPMEFQIETVRKALAAPRPRLLLADAVGLGKTIQVGMILGELMRRGRADRILVLTKKSMLAQFQAELWNRFAVPLTRLDSDGITRLRSRIPAGRNPFEVYHRVIVSLDTLKNIGSYRHFLETTRWDCVVIDEAHNVAGASVPERHLSYRLAKLLSARTIALLLTTATPHNGRRETFGRLISLLDPSAIPDPEFKEYTAEDIRGFFLMRFKEDVRADAGEQLTDRMVVPLDRTTVPADPGEERVYDLLADFRRATLAAARTDPTARQPVLLQFGVYKQFLSSPESCLKTVRKRLKTIRADRSDTIEGEFLAKLERALEPLALATSSRFRLLLDQLRAIGWDGSPDCPRVLIFTEYRETQEALTAALAAAFNLPLSDAFDDQAGQIIARIHGSFPDRALMDTVEAFGTGSSRMRMLVATDVASEGINLHHECHHVIHYDLPWSIITLIQRNGRVDRIGQKHHPVLRYLMVETARADLRGDRLIFEKLVAKVEEINQTTRQGESVLKLYDPEAEERFIAEEGLATGNAGVLDGGGDAEPSLLELLLAQVRLGAEAPPDDDAPTLEVIPPQPRLRLFADLDYLVKGCEFLAGELPDLPKLERHGDLVLVPAHAELARRLGKSTDGTIHGATAIPAEAWPDDDRFRLTDNPDRAEEAIRAARYLAGNWSRELLCTPLHPIVQWVTERLLMTMPRGKCPVVATRRLGPTEAFFCFVAQQSSNAGVPVATDAHAVWMGAGGAIEVLPLHEALDRVGFESIVNEGVPPDLTPVRILLASAVKQSINRIGDVTLKRVAQVYKALRPEHARLERWSERRTELLTRRIAELGETHPKARAMKKELDELKDFLDDRRKNWIEAHYATVAPTTTLVLTIVGKK